MRRRPEARPLTGALHGLAAQLKPASPLADAQRVWSQAVGPGVAAQAQPTALADGVLTVTCQTATWAQELDLKSPDLIAALNAALGGPRVTRLRCQAAPARSWQRKG